MGTLTLAEQDRLLADPNPLYFRYSQIQGGNACAEHAHPWGQLSLISLGVMVVEVGGERLVAPPDYLIWVPADLPHTAFNEQTLDYTRHSAPDLGINLPIALTQYLQNDLLVSC